jgi:hypothetical protein
VVGQRGTHVCPTCQTLRKRRAPSKQRQKK